MNFSFWFIAFECCHVTDCFHGYSLSLQAGTAQATHPQPWRRRREGSVSQERSAPRRLTHPLPAHQACTARLLGWTHPLGTALLVRLAILPCIFFGGKSLSIVMYRKFRNIPIDLMHWRHVSITTTPCWGSRLVALRARWRSQPESKDSRIASLLRASQSVRGPGPTRRYGMQGLARWLHAWRWHTWQCLVWPPTSGGALLWRHMHIRSIV